MSDELVIPDDLKKYLKLREKLLYAAKRAATWSRCLLNGRRGTYTIFLEEAADVERAHVDDGIDGGSITVPIRDYIAVANPANIKALIEGYDQQLANARKEALALMHAAMMVEKQLTSYPSVTLEALEKFNAAINALIDPPAKETK